MVAACPFPFPRGTPVRIFRMAEALGRRGHEVHVVTYHLGHPTGKIPFTIHRIPKVRTYNRYAAGPNYQKVFILGPLLSMTLRRVLRAHMFDLIHAHHYEGLLASTFARGSSGIPLIYDAHTLLGTELPFFSLGLPGFVKRALGQGIDRIVPGWSDHIITVTNNIRKTLHEESGIPLEKMTVVANGVEPDWFKPRYHSENPRENKTIVFSGNLAPYQRVDLLLIAFKEILMDRPGARLRVISDTPFDPYEDHASRLGIRHSIDTAAAEFHHLPDELAAADIAVSPRTECDGVPQKILNYMASGRAIVSFEGSGGYLEHGKTGCLVPNGDTHAFAKAVIDLLNQPERAAQLGINARRKVASEYTWDHTAEKAESVYRRLLEGTRT